MAAESPPNDMAAAMVELQFTPGHDEFVGYATAAQVRISAEEVLLMFGERDFDNSTVAETFAKIYLSLPHAKRLASALVGVIQAVEADIGQIDPDPAATIIQRRQKRQRTPQ